MSSPKPTSLAQPLELAPKPLMHTLESSTRDSNFDSATPSSSLASQIMKQKRTEQSCVTNISHVDTNEIDDISNINHFPANLQLENLNDTNIILECDSDTKIDLIKKICVTYFRDVPLLSLELASNILSRLPIKAVIRYQCVCKAWRDEIKSPEFIKSHTVKFDKANYDINSYVLLHSKSINLSSQDNWFCLDFGSSLLEVKKLTPLPHVPKGHCRVVGYCNGLLCLYVSEFGFNVIRFRICNIATGSLHITPNLIGKLRFHAGFGYDSSSNDYKILCFFPSTKPWVYSLKTNSWKTIRSVRDCNYTDICTRSNIIFSNNALHWINLWRMCIIGFDLGTETCHKIAFLPFADRSLPYKGLTDLRGSLHFVRFGLPNEQIDSYGMEIWVMTTYRSQWTKLIRINLQISTIGNSTLDYKIVSILPCAYSKDGKEILIVIEGTITKFICCELDNGKIKKFEVPGVPNKRLTAMPLDYFSLLIPSPSK